MAASLWIVAWHVLSVCVGQGILLVSPVSVVKKLFELALVADFWAAIGFSIARISAGLLSALVAAVILAVLAYRYAAVRELLAPFMSAVKAVPVASLTILFIFWVGTRVLSVPVTFLIVFPIAYSAVLEGLFATDRKLLEMADVFAVGFKNRALYIYLPQVCPFFAGACRSSVGLAFKSGVAAEVIGIVAGSIGGMLYESKIYLLTADLFAWTVVTVVVSAVAERVVLVLVALAERWILGV